MRCQAWAGSMLSEAPSAAESGLVDLINLNSRPTLLVQINGKTK